MRNVTHRAATSTAETGSSVAAQGSGALGAPGELRAFVAAPFVALLLWLAQAFVRIAAYDGFAAAVRDVPALLLGGATFGLAAAVAATVLLAGPLYALSSLGGRVGGLEAALWGAVVGAVVGLLLPPSLESLAPLWACAAIGLGTGAVWSALRRPARGATRE